MPDSRADQCIREQEQLESVRGTQESTWREIAQRVRPEQDFFQGQLPQMGQKREQYIFDSTAPLALSKYMAAVISMTMPSTGLWHGLTTQYDEINKRTDIKRYFEAVTKILFRMRYTPAANFQAQSCEVVMDHGAFGAGVLFIDDVVGIGIRYKHLKLAECFIDEDAHGVVNLLHRKHQWTGRQAVSMFGATGLSSKVRMAAEKGSQEKFWFMHCVRPNREIQSRRKDYRGMAFSSYYIEQETRSVIDEGGFRVFPFAVPRYESGMYGRSPAMKCLGSIKALNEMKKTIIRAGHLATSPPILLSDDGSLQPMNLRPNALNYGMIDDRGNPKAMAFDTKGRVDIGRELLQDDREIINDAFFVTLFRILEEAPQITATEAMLRAQEKGQLMAPPMGGLQTGLCGPTITRELDIGGHAQGGRLFPEMPDALKEIGGEIEIQYLAPINLAQRAGAGVGILNTLQAIAPLAEVDKRVMLIFKTQEIARELGEINGMPASCMNSEEEIAALEKGMKDEQQMQSLLAAAPVAASAAKDMAQASNLMGQSQQQAPAVLPA